MKKSDFCFVLILGVCFSFLTTPALSQDQEEERHVYVLQTWKTVMPEDGSAAERDSLFSEWFEAIPKKNDKILSAVNLRHFYGSDSHDWITILVYRNWEDMGAATEINQELFRKKWADAKKRTDFSRALGKYFDGHSDEIYRELPKFRK